MSGLDNELFQAIHRNAVDKGFWGRRGWFGDAPLLPDLDGLLLSQKRELIYSEVAELTEHARKGTSGANSEKLVGFTNQEEEIADILIRVIDYAVALGIDIESAVRAKHAYNTNRPYLHGKKF